jgi:hypothetical protein
VFAVAPLILYTQFPTLLGGKELVSTFITPTVTAPLYDVTMLL